MSEVTDETRNKWDERIAFLFLHSEHTDDWETEFVDSMELIRSRGRDLTLRQSFKLGKIFHKVEEKV